MTSLEVLGSATIWCAVIFLSLLITAILWEIISGWLRRWRVQRAVWAYENDTDFVDAEALEDLISYEADHWWRKHEEERAWCRHDDFRAGLRFAALMLVHNHKKIIKRPAPKTDIEELDSSARWKLLESRGMAVFRLRGFCAHTKGCKLASIPYEERMLDYHAQNKPLPPCSCGLHHVLDEVLRQAEEDPRSILRNE